MIIWINGPFGVGKTTVAMQLLKVVPEAVHFDPELIGRLVRRTIPEIADIDYQELPLWREAVVDFALRLDQNLSGPIVVPMTLWTDHVYEEIIGGLLDGGSDVLHFTLIASPDTILERIAASDDEGATEWRTEHLSASLGALGRARYATHIDTEHLSVESIAALIAERAARRRRVDGGDV